MYDISDIQNLQPVRFLNFQSLVRTISGNSAKTTNRTHVESIAMPNHEILLI